MEPIGGAALLVLFPMLESLVWERRRSAGREADVRLQSVSQGRSSDVCRSFPNPEKHVRDKRQV